MKLVLKKPLVPELFLVEKNAIHIIYAQGLCWMALPFSPFVAVLMGIVLFLDFKVICGLHGTA